MSLPHYTLIVEPSALTGEGTSIALAVEAPPSSPDTITFSDGGAGGTFSPSTLTVDSPSLQTVTYTNATAGTYTITATSGAGGTVWGSGSKIKVTQALPPSYTLTAAYQNQVGGPVVLTYTPTAFVASDTLTPSDGGAGGTFTPSTLTFTNTTEPQSTVYRPAHASITISFSSTAGASIPPVVLKIIPLI